MIAERPQAVRVDGARRLHCDDGPAFAWLTDIREYYVHGVHVPAHVVMQPGQITAADIELEQNVEVRRILIAKYGQARFLTDSGAEKIQEDDYGALYRKQIAGDEPLVMVKVVNATPEPDGTFKDYFLRVPPAMKTAREAVAWTFDLPAERYAPAKQT